MRRSLALLFSVLLLALARAEPPKWTLTVAKVARPEALAQELRDALDPVALTVSDEAGPRITIWFRAELPAQATAEQVANGLTYREIAEGTFVGVVKFEKPFTDFRKQEIPAGAYTLRLAVQPDVGDHKDTAPHQDFLLLMPLDSDTSLETVESKDLLARSRKVTGADHPAVVLLFPHFGRDAEPKLVAKPGDVQLVQLRRAVVAGDAKTTLGFGVVVAGFSATRK